MPVCYITFSEAEFSLPDNTIHQIRDIIAAGLNSKSRLLDRNHIVIRTQTSRRCYMLGEIELDIYAQFFFRRFWSRDKRARMISEQVSKLLQKDCATWINMGIVGYARVTKSGESYFSD